MAKPAPSPAPQAPPPPPPTPAPIAAPAVTPKKHDVLRPFRYASAFIGGTVTGTLDGMANGGRKASWLGMGIGTLAWLTMATPIGVAAVAVGWALGLATGAVGGGLLGLFTGGIRTMDREHRKNKYSDDLLERARAKSQPQPHHDYRQAHRDYQQQSNYMFDRTFQQARENNEEVSTYFRDRVDESRHHHFEQGL